jgi:hypothetical protein
MHINIRTTLATGILKKFVFIAVLAYFIAPENGVLSSFRKMVAIGPRNPSLLDCSNRYMRITCERLGKIQPGNDLEVVFWPEIPPSSQRKEQ